MISSFFQLKFTRKSVQDYLSSFAFHVGMVVGEPILDTDIYDVVAVIGIEANPTETPWRSLRDSIKAGARQLENGSLGIIAIYYADPVLDFEALCPAPGYMRVFVGKLLDKYKNVGAVLMTSEHNLQLPEEVDSARVRIYYKRPWPFPPDFLSYEAD